MESEKDFSKRIWDQLTKEEQALMMAYLRKLNQDRPVKEMEMLIKKANDLHEKYPDYSMGCVP